MFSHANSWVRFFILYLAGGAEYATVYHCIPGIILMHLKYSSEREALAALLAPQVSIEVTTKGVYRLPHAI